MFFSFQQRTLISLLKLIPDFVVVVLLAAITDGAGHPSAFSAMEPFVCAKVVDVCGP